MLYFKVIDLHPTDPDAESALAKVGFGNRTMSLEIKTNSYGSSESKTIIYFNNSEDMCNLAKALVEAADIAENYFKKNP